MKFRSHAFRLTLSLLFLSTVRFLSVGIGRNRRQEMRAESHRIRGVCEEEREIREWKKKKF